VNDDHTLTPSGTLPPDAAAFLDAFAAAVSAADHDSVSRLFSEQFLVGDASSAKVITRDQFADALPARAAAAHAAGVGTAELTGARALALDDSWTVLWTDWQALVSGATAMTMRSTFLVHSAPGGSPVAHAYLNHAGLGVSRNDADQSSRRPPVPAPDPAWSREFIAILKRHD